MPAVVRHLALILLLVLTSRVGGQELRGAWMARDAFTSRATISNAMSRLATNGFNTVFVNAWSRGMPLWKSLVFSNETGVATDASYGGRDILQEAIDEGKRVGLRVVPWFEYGFVGWWNGTYSSTARGPLLTLHPDWIGRQVDGTQAQSTTTAFYWMVHTKPEVQDFLIRLFSELPKRYAVDGLQFDRIEWPTTYGYDAFTTNAYFAETGLSAPTNHLDAAWMRWRADKLTAFAGRLYDTIKSNHPNLHVCFSPSLYSSTTNTAYRDLLQDWPRWVNSGKADSMQVQIYTSSESGFGNILNYATQLVTNRTKVHPSFAVKPNGNFLADSTMALFASNTRQKTFGGIGVWYDTDIAARSGLFGTNLFQTRTNSPLPRPAIRLNRVQVEAGGAVELRWDSEWYSGPYRVQSSSNLASPLWRDSASTSATGVTVTNLASNQFFRVVGR